MVEKAASIMDAVNRKAELSGGHNGIFLPDLMRITGLKMDDLKSELNILWKEDKITIRDGIHGKLIFKK